MICSLILLGCLFRLRYRFVMILLFVLGLIMILRRLTLLSAGFSYPIYLMNIWILLWLGFLGLMLLFASFVTIPYGFWLMGFCDRSGLFILLPVFLWIGMIYTRWLSRLLVMRILLRFLQTIMSFGMVIRSSLCMSWSNLIMVPVGLLPMGSMTWLVIFYLFILFLMY